MPDTANDATKVTDGELHRSTKTDEAYDSKAENRTRTILYDAAGSLLGKVLGWPCGRGDRHQEGRPPTLRTE